MSRWYVYDEETGRLHRFDSRAHADATGRALGAKVYTANLWAKRELEHPRPPIVVGEKP